MKRMRGKAGFTLLEMLVTIVIIVILFAGVTVSMEAGSEVYRQGIFVSDSSLLADTLNYNLTDVLRNAKAIRKNNGDGEIPDGVDVVFNNSSYGANKAHLWVSGEGRIVLKSGDNEQPLVNTGAYPDLKIDNLEVTYYPKVAAAATDGTQYGGYFDISYTIVSRNDPSLSKEVQLVVRQLNN